MAKFMIAATASNAPSRIIHDRDDEPCWTESRGQASTQCNWANTIHAIHNKLPERRDEQVDRHNAVRETNRNQKLSWRDELKVPNDYVAYPHKRFKMVVLFETMWDGPLVCIKGVQHRTKLEKSKARPINSASYRAGRKARYF